MNEKTMLESLGATSIAEALKVKTSAKQIRMFSARKPQLVTLTEDECKALCDKVGVKYAPGYEQRVVQYVVTNETPDRYGDIVRAAGCRSENYMRNPVMFFAHNYSSPPIGNTVKLWVDNDNKRVMAWGLFVSTDVDTTGFSDLIFRFVSSGFMRACSVGFQPEKAYMPTDPSEREKIGLGKYGVEYRIWDMLEWSPCGVPANPQALQASLKDVGARLHLDKAHLDAAEKFHLFSDVNMLDTLVEGLKPAKTTPLQLKPLDIHRGIPGLDLTMEGVEVYKSEGIAIDGEIILTEDATEDIVLHPYPNEHACRLKNPKDFDKFRRGKRKSDGKEYAIIFGRVKGKETWEQQAYRYNKDVWEAKDARKHCKEAGGSFSAAVDKPTDEERVYLSCEDGACEMEVFAVSKDDNGNGGNGGNAPVPANPVSDNEADEGNGEEPEVASVKPEYIAKIGELWDGTCVYLVDGEDVREEISGEFFIGGHGYYDKYIPENEIWLEEIKCTKEMQMNLVHKIVEYILMKYLESGDTAAHLQALSVESLIRKMGQWEVEEEEEEEGDENNGNGNGNGGEPEPEAEATQLFGVPFSGGLYDSLPPAPIPSPFSTPRI